ncbi:TonB-dependent receptor [Microbulbifer taiwanensis]|uniref:TonB-dependent receptor n=1 Tax=Microbulbifer taiwanensis TaxID=986746 RepID=A0ABW1YNX1_9GAMM|nr:TonB-dependent receptor [Microbulbifer taiwanensis]
MIKNDRIKCKRQRLPLAVAMATSIAGSAIVEAAELEEVVVTARKRSESLQDIPVAVSALTGDSLREKGISQVTDLTGHVPNLKFDVQPQSGGSAARIFVRGIGQSDFNIAFDPGVGTYVDGIYMGRSQGGVFGLVDIERIEVLRGPQGTLFGKNATGGAINVITAKPSEEAGARVEMRVGNHQRLDAKAVADIPLVDDVLLSRVSLASKRAEGYTENIFLGKKNSDDEELAGRVQLLWMPSDGVEVSLSHDRFDVNEGTVGYECRVTTGTDSLLGGLIDAAFPTFYSDCAADADNGWDKFESGDYSQSQVASAMSAMTLDWAASEDLSIKWITGHRQLDSLVSGESDYTRHPVSSTRGYTDVTVETFSQELQFSWTALDGRLSWVGGLYYFREDAHDSDTASNLPYPDALLGGVLPVEALSMVTESDPANIAHRPLNSISEVQLDTLSYAAFSQLSYDMTDRLGLTLGLRRTVEEREAQVLGYCPPSSLASLEFMRNALGPWVPSPCQGQVTLLDGSTNSTLFATSGDETFTNLSPMASASYRWHDDLMTYLTYSEGFKSGGFNVRNRERGNTPVFDPETVSSLEWGLKSTWFERALKLNLAVFWNDYSDMQIPGMVASTDAGGSTVFRIENAADATTKGVELEMVAFPTPQLMLSGSIGYIDAAYDDFTVPHPLVPGLTLDRSDDDFSHTPEWQFQLGGQYSVPLAEMGELQLRAHYYRQAETRLGVQGANAEAYGLLDGRIVFVSADETLELGLWGRNLTDERYIASISPLGVALGVDGYFYGEPRSYGLELAYRY